MQSGRAAAGESCARPSAGIPQNRRICPAGRTQASGTRTAPRTLGRRFRLLLVARLVCYCPQLLDWEAPRFRVATPYLWRASRRLARGEMVRSNSGDAASPPLLGAPTVLAALQAEFRAQRWDSG